MNDIEKLYKLITVLNVDDDIKEVLMNNVSEVLYDNDITIENYKMKKYNPKFLSWCTSLDQEIREIKELIESNPADVELIKEELVVLEEEKNER